MYSYITFHISHLQACCVLWATLGFKKAFNVCLNYPALVLTPCFGSWTFGPGVQTNASTSNCCMSFESHQIRASYFHTWVNYGIALVGAIITFFVGYYDLSRFDIDVKNFFTSGFRDQWVAGVVLISWFLILVVLPICIGFVQTVDNCCNFLCKCCSSKCFPVVQHSVLDVDNMD